MYLRTQVLRKLATKPVRGDGLVLGGGKLPSRMLNISAGTRAEEKGRHRISGDNPANPALIRLIRANPARIGHTISRGSGGQDMSSGRVILHST